MLCCEDYPVDFLFCIQKAVAVVFVECKVYYCYGKNEKTKEEMPCI